MIDAARFKAATGRDPVDDDLDRVNCPDAGKDGHWQCGWDYDANRPVYETGSQKYRQERSLPEI